MLREDLDGIEASQRISAAVEAIDDALRWVAHGGSGGLSGVLNAEGASEASDGTGNGADAGKDGGGRLGPGAAPGTAAGPGTAAAGDPLLSDARRRAVLHEVQRQSDLLDQYLRLQTAGQTLPHERDKTAQLTDHWNRYRENYGPLLEPGSPLTPAQRRELYADTLVPQAGQIKAAADEIFSINVDNMRSTRGSRGEASTIARSAQFAMHALTLCGAALATGFALLLGRIIVGPVRTLTESVQQVQQGNLDLEVPVRSNDEMGRLGEAFNEMASQLRVFRRIDHEKLIRSQRTTQLAIDSLPDAVVVINPQGNIELTNETAKRLFGLHPGVPVDSLPDKRLAELHRRAWRDEKSHDEKSLPATAGSGSNGAAGATAGAGYGSS